MSPAFITGRPSSVKHTHPAAASSPSSAISSPARPLLMAPAGHTRARRAACSALLDEARHQRRVIRRPGVGHGHHRGEAAGHRSPRPGENGFLPLIAWLTQVDVQVDEARAHPQPGDVHLARSVRGQGAVRDGDHLAPPQEDVVHAVQRPARVNDPAAAQQNASSGHAQASRMAMRTATPCETCARITLDGPSATSGEISTPRLTGPGCITSAPGLSRSARSAVRPYIRAYSRTEGT